MSQIVLPGGLREQPRGPASINRQNPIGAALDHVWIGNDLSGRDVAGGLIVPPLAGSALKAGTMGLALTNTGATGTPVDVPAIAGYPYIQVAVGYFLSAASNFVISDIGSSASGNSSRIQLNSSSVVAASIRFNFGTARSVTISQGSVSTGRLLCAILQVFSETDYRFYVNGLQGNGSLTLGSYAPLNKMMPLGGTLNGGIYLTGYGAGRTISDELAQWITKNPSLIWDIFRVPGQSPSLAAGFSSLSFGLSGSAQAIASAYGALAVAIPISGASIGVASSSGALSIAIPLSGVAAGLASASGVVSLGVAISGTALSSVSASGQMKIAIALSGAAIAQAVASGSLGVSSGAGLSGAAYAQASAGGALSMAIPMAGAAQVHAGSTGNLTTGNSVSLSGTAVAVSAAYGTLTVAIRLSGSAMAQAVALGGMRIQIPLSGAAVVSAISSGALSSGVAVSEVIHAALDRTFVFTRTPRFSVFTRQNRTIVARRGRTTTIMRG